jgi:diguanylate cyclase
MSAHDPNLTPRTSRGLLDWFRAGSGGAQPSEAPAPAEVGVVLPNDPIYVARQQLLLDINDFLLVHHLEITPFTLGIACDYLTGSDNGLMRAIDARMQAREPITVAWLEKARSEGRDDQSDVLMRLIGKMESNIEEFGRTTKEAKTAANDYSSALTVHVDDLGSKAAAHTTAVPLSPDVLGELVGLARAMLERTRGLESDMARSVLESRALKRSLMQARRTAEEDHLTGLPNRRAFEARFAKEYHSARDAGDQLCVAFCDIDHFKRVNDDHGHEAGDRVLKTVAECLSKISDDRCHVARHGGEEFVVLLRGQSLHSAWEVLDDLRAQMAERRMVNRQTDQPFGKVTFSGGIADVFAFPDPRAALRAADKALYRAKAEGRNRILVAEET